MNDFPVHPEAATAVPQEVSLNHPDTSALFAKADEGTRVYYSLEGLVNVLTHDLLRQTATATMMGMPEEARHYLLGQTDLIENLIKQRDDLAAVFEAHTAMDGKVTLADFGFTEGDGTLS